MSATNVSDVLLQLALPSLSAVDRSIAYLSSVNGNFTTLASHNVDGRNTSTQEVVSNLRQIVLDHGNIWLNIARSRQSPSVVVRAVSSEVEYHARQFVDFVARVESMVMQDHPNLIVEGEVSLLKLTTIFQSFAQILHHLRSVAAEIGDVQDHETPPILPVNIINKLRGDTMTGYSNLRQVTVDLSRAADRVFLFQVKKWCLRGELYSSYKDDFFVEKLADGSFVLVQQNCPDFISFATARQVYVLGTIMPRILQTHARSETEPQDFTVLKSYEASFAKVNCPIDDVTLLAAIGEIKRTLSQNTLTTVLPRAHISGILKFVQAYFLLEDGEFALALIDRSQQDFNSMLRSVTQLKDSTVQALLAKTLSCLKHVDDNAVSHYDEDEGDKRCEPFVMPTTSLRLTIVKEDEVGPSTTVFSDFLFGVPVQLHLQIKWPLDIFLTEDDVFLYDRLFEYLIAIRRAHGRLHGLWRGRRSESTESTIPNATWSAAYRTQSYLGKLLEFYHTDVIQTFSRRMAAMVQPQRYQRQDREKDVEYFYNPFDMADRHRAALRNLHDAILLPHNDFGAIMRRLLVSIDQMVEAVKRHRPLSPSRSQERQEVDERCVATTRLVEKAVRELTLEKGVDALLSKLQVG